MSVSEILRIPVSATSYDSATRMIIDWAMERESRIVIAANVHVIMEAHDSPTFGLVVRGADLVAPDGMPLVWILRAIGAPDASRVYGPTLTLSVCEAAAKLGIPIALYGGTPESLRNFEDALTRRFAGLSVVCRIAPPFRQLSPEEDRNYTDQLATSGARIVLVGIGCPKQERWMAAHKDRIAAVMLGVGAAFDFHSGQIPQAPNWMQRVGLEWLFRLIREPRRLWKRYLKHNPRFVWLVASQLLQSRLSRKHVAG